MMKKFKLHDVATVLLSFALVFSPWVTGVADPWAMIVIAAACVGAAVLRLCGGERRSTSRKSYWVVPFVLLSVYIGIQALNPSHVYSEQDAGLTPVAHKAWLPHSADRFVSGASLARLVMFGAAFVAAGAVATVTRQRMVIALLVANGFCMALWAICTRQLPAPPGEPIGPFLNENAYAAYMNLLIPVTLSFGRDIETEASAYSRKSHPGHLCYFAAVCMIVSVAVSESRAGMMVCTLIVAGWTWLALTGSRKRASCERVTRVTACAPVGLAVVLLVVVGLNPVKGEPTTSSVSQGLAQRGLAAAGTWTMFRDNPVFGTGAGTFHCTFPYYQPKTLPGFYRYAHNDWLQYLAELGLAGSVLMAVTMLTVLRDTFANTTWSSIFPLGCMLAIGGVCVHAVIDFPLHIPAVTLLAISFVVFASCSTTRVWKQSH